MKDTYDKKEHISPFGKSNQKEERKKKKKERQHSRGQLKRRKDSLKENQENTSKE